MRQGVGHHPGGGRGPDADVTEFVASIASRNLEGRNVPYQSDGEHRFVFYQTEIGLVDSSDNDTSRYYGSYDWQPVFPERK